MVPPQRLVSNLPRLLGIEKDPATFLPHHTETRQKIELVYKAPCTLYHNTNLTLPALQGKSCMIHKSKYCRAFTILKCFTACHKLIFDQIIKILIFIFADYFEAPLADWNIRRHLFDRLAIVHISSIGSIPLIAVETLHHVVPHQYKNTNTVPHASCFDRMHC